MSNTVFQLIQPSSFSSTDMCRLFLASISGYPPKVYMRLDKEYVLFDDSAIRYGLVKCLATCEFQFIRYLTPEESLTIHGKTK